MPAIHSRFKARVAEITILSLFVSPVAPVLAARGSQATAKPRDPGHRATGQPPATAETGRHDHRETGDAGAGTNGRGTARHGGRGPGA